MRFMFTGSESVKIIVFLTNHSHVSDFLTLEICDILSKRKMFLFLVV